MRQRCCKYWGSGCCARCGCAMDGGGRASASLCWASRHPARAPADSCASLELPASVTCASMTATAGLSLSRQYRSEPVWFHCRVMPYCPSVVLLAAAILERHILNHSTTSTWGHRHNFFHPLTLFKHLSFDFGQGSKHRVLNADRSAWRILPMPW